MTTPAYNLGDMVVDGPLTRSKLLTRDVFSDAEVERFSALVDRPAGLDVCYLWTGCRDSKGYGRIKFAGRTVKAHRIAYVLAFGFIPAGLVVRHRCDNPQCVRPNHLQLGTNRDNTRDRVERGRGAIGEGNGMAKLDAEKVNDMRRRAREGATYVELAREYGVTHIAVRDAVTGKRWENATEPPVVGLRRPRRQWTPAEDAVVFDGKLTEVAERLGRTVASVENRRRNLRRRDVRTAAGEVADELAAALGW